MRRRPPLVDNAPMDTGTTARGRRMTARAAPPRITWREDGIDLMELLLVAAIATVLVVRFFLAATGYPQVGGGGLHIAHVLWGGLLMLVGALVLLSSLAQSALRIGALLAGAGFGLFIDEVGKFITEDVDYFYQPAIAIIYVIFVLLALIIVALRRTVRLTPRLALANALALAAQGISEPGANDARRRALALLTEADPADPLTGALRTRLAAAGGAVAAAPGRWVRIAHAGEALYRRIVLTRAFRGLLIAIFALLALSTIASTIALVVDRFGVGPVNRGGGAGVQVLASLAVAVLTVIGIARLHRSRLSAYRWFLRAVLTNILVVQVFNFYDSQLVAVVGLGASLVAYTALRYAVAQEEATAAPAPSPPVTRVAAAPPVGG